MKAPLNPLLVLVFAVQLSIVSINVSACDSDADCGAGGTCIKREKRASGVCYGGDFDAPAATPDSARDTYQESAPTVAPKPVEGELRERAEAWMGNPEQMLRQNLPGEELGGVCMVNQDCPDGFECVIAGFEGRCVRL